MNFVLIFILFLFFLCCSFKTSCRSNEKKCVLLYILSVGLIIACRGEDVPDTLGYLDYYNEIDAADFSHFNYYLFEPGFQFFTHVVKIVVGNVPAVYFFIIVFIISCLLWDAIQRILLNLQKNNRLGSAIKLPVLYAFVLFYSYYGIFYGGITIRAGIAMSLYLETLSLLCKERLYKKDVLFISILFVLAFLFHVSSVVYLPIILIFRFTKPLSKKGYLLILLFCSVLFFSRINMVVLNNVSSILSSLVMRTENSDLSKFSLYTDALVDSTQKISFKYVFQLLSGFVFLYGNLKEKIYYCFLNIYILGVVLGAVFAPISMMYRILDFFYIITFILYTLLFLSLKFHKNIFYISCGLVFFQLILIYRLIYA